VTSLSQGRTAAAQCGLFTHKSVPVIFEPPCICFLSYLVLDVNKRISVMVGKCVMGRSRVVSVAI